MTTREYQLCIDGLVVNVVRKPVKYVRIAVYRSGAVRVAAPLRLSAAFVRDAITTRLPWIRRQQERFASQVRPPTLRCMTGENHFYLGAPYRLEVVPTVSRPRIVIPDENTMELHIAAQAGEEDRRGVLRAWYRQRLKALIPPLVDQWTPRIGVRLAEWRVRHMKTKWGTCNTRARRIWLNVDLARKPPECIEYVVVHELVHLLEAGHNDRFRGFMDSFMPDWRDRVKRLNRSQDEA